MYIYTSLSLSPFFNFEYLFGFIIFHCRQVFSKWQRIWSQAIKATPCLRVGIWRALASLHLHPWTNDCS